MVTCRLQRASGDLEADQNRARKIKGLASSWMGMPAPGSAALCPNHKEDFILGRFGF